MGKKTELPMGIEEMCEYFFTAGFETAMERANEVLEHKGKEVEVRFAPDGRFKVIQEVK